jgi:chromosome segregation ATPase
VTAKLAASQSQAEQLVAAKRQVAALTNELTEAQQGAAVARRKSQAAAAELDALQAAKRDAEQRIQAARDSKHRAEQQAEQAVQARHHAEQQHAAAQEVKGSPSWA